MRRRLDGSGITLLNCDFEGCKSMRAILAESTNQHIQHFLDSSLPKICAEPIEIDERRGTHGSGFCAAGIGDHWSCLATRSSVSRTFLASTSAENGFWM